MRQPFFRRLKWGRPITSYSKVQRWVGTLLRSRIPTASFKDLKFLNAGCGPNIREGFINLDYNWRPGVLCWDLGARLPIASNSLHGVFTEHCLEHMTPDSVQSALHEFHRVLRPGGILRVVVPDAGLYARLYVEASDGGTVEWPLRSLHGSLPMDALNAVFHHHGHLVGYDFETLAERMGEAGFKSVERAAFARGREPRLLIDTPARAPESLYLEGIKG